MEPVITPESTSPVKTATPHHEEQKEQDSPMPAAGLEEPGETASGKKQGNAEGVAFPPYMQTRRGGEKRYLQESPPTDDEIEDEVARKLKGKQNPKGVSTESPEQALITQVEAQRKEAEEKRRLMEEADRKKMFEELLSFVWRICQDDNVHLNTHKQAVEVFVVAYVNNMDKDNFHYVEKCVHMLQHSDKVVRASMIL